MKVVATFNDMRNNSIKVWNGVVEMWPEKNRQGRIWTERLNFDRLEKKYAEQNGIVAFVYRNGLWVIPKISGVLAVLEKEGFKQADLNVPFSTGSYPVPRKQQWEDLLKARDQF